MRARAILEAAERAAAAESAPPRGGQPAAAPPAADPPGTAPPPPKPQAPRQDWSRSVQSAPIPATAPGQLLAIVDQVMHAAEAARRRLDELSVTLDELTRRVDAAGRSAPPPPPAAPPPPAVTAPPADTPLRARPRPPAPSDHPSADAGEPPEALAATAKLIAVEMAVAGASRMDVDRRLRDQLGMRTTHEVLDEVFGAGSPPSARLS
ncbi:hypothetical protein DSM104329_00705 [Capillimicrobium parvum]|uniref:Uncharacterized protein n=2 Tax=Capillimicrobium parvum TaxID=2884022 RepID=A0A9E6XTN4_9ACTN|nr:hypothetical protein DSM104329_00705 [Capillimicrobium parvum]